MRVEHKAKDLPPKPPTTNTFALYFQIEQVKGGGIKRGQTNFVFDPQQFPALLNNDTPTEAGYQVLLETLTDIIIQLAETAEKSSKLNADALKRKAATKISGARRLKLIGMN